MMAAALPHSRKSLQPARDHDSAKWACEKRLGNYIRQAWNVVEPATAFLDNWHLDLIAEYIEAVTAGQITIAQARDRERQVLQLFLRGLSWVEIGRQLGFSSMGAIKAFNRAFKRIPAKDVEKLRTLQSERLNDARRRVYTELAGHQEPDPANPGQMRTVRPTTDEVYTGVDRILRIEIREANLYGLDAPKKSDIVSTVMGQAISDEVLDEQLARLTPQEQETFMMLLQKLQGRWVEPPALEAGSIETTATTVQSNGAGS